MIGRFHVQQIFLDIDDIILIYQKNTGDDDGRRI